VTATANMFGTVISASVGMWKRLVVALGRRPRWYARAVVGRARTLGRFRFGPVLPVKITRPRSTQSRMTRFAASRGRVKPSPANHAGKGFDSSTVLEPGLTEASGAVPDFPELSSKALAAHGPLGGGTMRYFHSSLHPGPNDGAGPQFAGGCDDGSSDAMAARDTIVP